MEKTLSNTDDFTWGHGSDELLRQMGQELGLMSFDDNPYDIIAAIMWLDKAQGIAQEGDYVLVHQSLAMWILDDLDIVDPEIRGLRDGARKGDEPNPADEARFEELVTKPFRIRMSDEEYIPPNIRGQEISIALMSVAEMESSQFGWFAVSVRSDGTLITQTPTLRRL